MTGPPPEQPYQIPGTVAALEPGGTLPQALVYGAVAGLSSIATPPSSPSANDLWYDSANNLWKQWNGTAWQLAGTASPVLGFRPADIPLVDILFAGQGGGFSPTYSGTGASGNNTDPVNLVLGTFGVSVTTGGTGQNTKISGTFGQALNLTGKSPVIWLKLANYAHFQGGYPRLYLGDTGLSNAYYWKLTESAGQPWALDGEWLRITLPFGTATTVGSPSRSSLAAMTLQVFDDSVQPVSMYLGGLATMSEPADWPAGVVSLCFDDGYISQFTAAKPYMDKYGYRATAYLITETLWNHGAYPGYYDIPTAQALEWYSGWEIGAHAYTAANHNAGYTTIGDSASLADMQAAKSYLRDQGFKAVEQFAYPLGNYGAGTLANTRRLFGSGRTISSVGGFPDETFPPADLARLRSVPVSANSVLATIEGYVTAAQANKEWLLLTMHDIQAAASGNLQFSTANFQALMDFISASGIAVAPVSEVLRGAPKPSIAVGDISPVGTANAAGVLTRPAAADHTHGSAGPGAMPADMGLIAWNMDFALVSATNNITPGTVYVHAVWLRSAQTITNLIWDLGTVTAWTCTGSECFMALFDSGGTQRGITADQSSNWNAPGYKSAALTSPYAAVPGKYYVAILMNGSGTTFTARGASSIPTFGNVGLTGTSANLRFAVNGTGATAMPGSLTVSSNTNTNALPTAVGLS